MRTWISLMLLLLSSLAWAAPEDDAKKQMERGVKLFEQSKYAEASLAFTKALEILPDAAGPHRELGKCYQKLNDLDRSIHHYTEYLVRRPDAQERSTIEALIAEYRSQLPKQERALLTILASPGAAVYAVTESGEARGIGISPFAKHPLEPRFTQIKLVPAGAPLETKISLSKAQELKITELDFATKDPLSDPIKKEPPPQPINPTTIATKDEPPPQTPKPKKSRAALGAFTLSGLSAVGAGVFMVSLFGTTAQMDAALLQLDEASTLQERQDLSQELLLLEGEALVDLRLAQTLSVVALTAASVGVALFVKAKKEATTLLISPQQATLSVSF